MLRASLIVVVLASAYAAPSVPVALSSPPHASLSPQDGTPQARAGCPPRQKALFGTKEKTAVSMEGRIYLLPEETTELPDFRTLKAIGSIYASEWDISERSFTEGFPGVTDRFEWFAIDYQGTIYVPQTGEYQFRLGSDDGSILYLDDKVVIDINGQHPWVEQRGQASLKEGDHKFRLSFYQGPRDYLGLQLWVTPPGGEEKIFALQDFNRGVLQNRSKLGVRENENEIQIKLGAEVLFDTGKYDLKPAATTALTQLAELLRSYPGYPIVIEGHTDSVGTPASNETLSQNRAAAVKTWLVESGQVQAGCIETVGFGQRKPVATNDTPDGRQQNRRVEIRLLKADPLTPEVF